MWFKIIDMISIRYWTDVYDTLFDGAIHLFVPLEATESTGLFVSDQQWNPHVSSTKLVSTMQASIKCLVKSPFNHVLSVLVKPPFS